MWAGEAICHLAGMIGALKGVGRQYVVLFVQTAQQRLQRLSCYICSDHIIPHQLEHHTFIKNITDQEKQRAVVSQSTELIDFIEAVLCVKLQWCFGCFIRDYSILNCFLKKSCFIEVLVRLDFVLSWSCSEALRQLDNCIKKHKMGNQWQSYKQNSFHYMQVYSLSMLVPKI